MKKLLVLGALLLGFQAAQAGIFGDSPKKYENTICFSYSAGDNAVFDDVELNGRIISSNNANCKNKSIAIMNKEGWRVVQVITGLNRIGVLFEREID